MYPEFTYASFGNHFVHFGRFILAFLLIYIYIPRKIFNRYHDTALENLFSGFMKMTFFIMAIGYFLVLVKIFEAITLIAVFLLLGYIRYTRKKVIFSFYEILSKLQMNIFDYLDGIKNPTRQIRDRTAAAAAFFKAGTWKKYLSPNRLLILLVFILIFGYSAYIRFFDAFTSAAVPFADSYTVMAWTKHLSLNILFYPDGGEVYPRGLDFHLAVLQKFSFDDAIYVLKYTGPLNSMITVAGVYFAISRFTGRMFPAVLSAGIYGMLGSYLHIEFSRQAATNSQEFAFAFILPTLFFFHRYLQYNKTDDLWTAFAGLSTVALLHQLVLAYMGTAMGLLLLVHIISNIKKCWYGVFMICLAGIASVAVSSLPFILGWLMDAPFHSSSVSFLVSQIKEISYPRLQLNDWISISAFGIGILFFLGTSSKKRKMRSGEIFLVLLILATFLVFYFAAFTKSEMLVTRVGEFWGLMQAVSIGLGWNVILSVLEFIDKSPMSQASLFVCAFILLALFLKPVPLQPFKLEREADVEQYLRISKNFTDKSWVIASSWHKFALVLGKGFHLYTELLLKFDPVTLDYKPSEGESVLEWKNLQQNIFIFEAKNIYRLDKSINIYKEEEERTYSKQEQEKPLLEAWIKAYSENHDNLKIFYEDENLRVLYIKKPNEDEKKKNWKRLWGYKYKEYQEVASL